MRILAIRNGPKLIGRLVLSRYGFSAINSETKGPRPNTAFVLRVLQCVMPEPSLGTIHMSCHPYSNWVA
jgi:hypothetical protein